MRTVLLILLTAMSFSLFGQTTKATSIAKITKAIHIGKTKPLRDLVSMKPMSQEKKLEWKKNFKAPRNFEGRGGSLVVHPELEHQGADKIRQSSYPQKSLLAEATVKVNVEGSTSGSPNDPTGDIGKDHYVHAINSTLIGIYDKEGNEIVSFPANNLWSSIGFTSAGDPIVLYDQEVDRWIITEFPSGNQLLVAVSEDSDPMGVYNAYNFQTPSFPDYPKYGIWKDAITVTTNEGGPSNLHAYAINKEQLYASKSEVSIQRIELPGNTNTEAGFYVATPVDWIGQNVPKDNKPIFLALNDSSWGDVAEDEISLFTLDIDWEAPANTSFEKTSIVTSPFDGNPCSVPGFGFSCMPQGGSPLGLDGIPEVIMNQAVYRNFLSHESLVFNFITDVTDGENLSGIRWVELRRTDSQWELYQEGTFAPDDGLDRYMGSLAIDGSGNIALAYNVSSEDEFVGVRYTGRKWDDELGLMTVEEGVLIEGTNSISSGARFGDYAQMGIDPVDDKTFWYTTEYGGGGGSNSTTRIVALEIERDDSDLSAGRILFGKVSGFTGEQSINVQINNLGLSDASNFQIGYILDDQDPVIEDFTDIFSASTELEYTFTQKAMIEEIGEHTLKTFVSWGADEVVYNDTLLTELRKIGAIDPALPGGSLESSVSCEDDVDGFVTIFNNGGDTLKSLSIEIFVNGDSYDIFEWEGLLAYCGSEVFDFTLVDLPPGQNVVEVVISNPNGLIDENLENNSTVFEFEVLVNGVTVFVTIFTDPYPEETTWTITDSNDNTVASGGPYLGDNTEYNLELCLKKDSCYTFTINDSYGDGIFSPGTYEITNSFGSVLASMITNDFGLSETNVFCVDEGCVLEVSVTTTVSTGDNGTIVITPTGGSGPFMFSIDGGMTFQDNGVFENLDAGVYEIVLQDSENCIFNGIAEVESCQLQVVVEFEAETDIAKGAINIIVDGGSGSYEYSFDGGETWQSSPLFNDLDAGLYDVVVRDEVGCIYEETVEIQFTINTSESMKGTILTATPNPSEGIYQLVLKGDVIGGQFLEYSVLNGQGKNIQSATLVKYDEEYIGTLNLFNYPAGVYYFQVKSENGIYLKRLVKL